MATIWYETPFLLGITPLNLGVAVVVAFVSFYVMSFALRLAIGAIARLPGAQPGQFLGDFREILAGTSHRLMVITASLIGLGTLHLPEPWSSSARHLWFVTLILQVALWANRAITLGLSRHFDRHGDEGAQAGASSTLLSWALRTLLWTVLLLAVLSNIGIDITAFIASLGIGGIAVALAVQNILGDLFASLSIAVDKPFEVGDFIGVGGIAGTVEYVGLKSTRIRSLGGEQIVMSNTDLLKQTISNYKRMATRRIVFSFGVTYDTSADQVAAIPAMVKSIVESSDQLRFDRAHFKSFGDSALNFEVVYIVLLSDFGRFMDFQQMINLELMRKLNALGIQFAFPTRTIYIASNQPPMEADPRPPAAGPAEGTIASA